MALLGVLAILGIVVNTQGTARVVQTGTIRFPDLATCRTFVEVWNRDPATVRMLPDGTTSVQAFECQPVIAAGLAAR